MNLKPIFLSNFAGVDFETDNVDRSIAQIIEEGVNPYNLEDQEWVPRDGRLHNNGDSEIGPYVSSVNNITKAMVKDRPDYTYEGSLLWELPYCMFVSHNAVYETAVIQQYLQPEQIDEVVGRWLCTYRMTKKLFGNDETFENLQLSYLRYRLNLQPVMPDIPHRAGYDAYVTGLLFEAIVDILIENGTLTTDPSEVNEDNVFEVWIEQLIAWYDAPIKIEKMPFGKHKGEDLKDVPHSYWTWALNNVNLFDEDHEDYDPDLTNAVIEVLEEQLGV